MDSTALNTRVKHDTNMWIIGNALLAKKNNMPTIDSFVNILVETLKLKEAESVSSDSSLNIAQTNFPTTGF